MLLTVLFFGCSKENKIRTAINVYMESEFLDDPNDFEITKLNYFVHTNKLHQLESIETQQQALFNGYVKDKLRVLHKEYSRKGGKWSEQKFVNSLFFKGSDYLKNANDQLETRFDLSLNNIYDLSKQEPEVIYPQFIRQKNTDLQNKYDSIDKLDNSIENFKLHSISGTVKYRSKNSNGKLELKTGEFKMSPEYKIWSFNEY